MAGSLNANAGPRYRHNADESAPYETITLDKLTPILGAEISGIDLSQPLKRITGLYEDAALEKPSGGDNLNRRHRKTQRARARDDEHRHRIHKRNA